MLKSLNTAATGMSAQQTNMDVIANNMANVNTTGFKKARAEFEDLMYQNIKEPGAVSGLNAVSPTGVQVGVGVRTSSVTKNFEDGSAKVTKGALDLQIEGTGFFAIQLPDGSTGYTRDGSFKKDPTGRIVDRNGNALIPQINIPQEASAVEILENGQINALTGINTEPQNIGQIELTTFVNPAGLKSVGKNLFVASPASGQPQVGNPGTGIYGVIAQGQLEASNVNIVDEMVNMITTQRAMETNSKVMQASDQMLQYMNNLR
jgi:flagellar basal-body rod protein FlgG